MSDPFCLFIGVFGIQAALVVGFYGTVCSAMVMNARNQKFEKEVAMVEVGTLKFLLRCD